MSWFYAKNGQQQGPITDEDLAAKVAAGEVRADTLVWKAGMPAWKPYREVAPAAAVPAVTAPESVAGPSDVPAADSAAAAPDEGPKLRLSPLADTSYCSECGRPLPARELMTYGNRTICATCKPAFFQRLAESGEAQQPGVNTTLEYAGFWIRFVAKFIDGIAEQIITRLILLPISVSAALGGVGFEKEELSMVNTVAVMAVSLGLAYVIMPLTKAFFLVKYGATPGKLALGLRVVRPDGARLTFGRAAGREYAEMLSGIICAIGYIIAAFDNPEKRALHDRICDTRVVYKRSIVSTT